MTNEAIRELITRRRRQILVHSCIYYVYNDNIISDSTWSKWAEELESLQNRFSELADGCPWSDAFKDFDHSTGFQLPLRDSWVMGTAEYLLNMKRRN